jgi:hypothetical protein
MFVLILVAALRRADFPPKKSYRLFLRLRNISGTKCFTDALCSNVGATKERDDDDEEEDDCGSVSVNKK